MICHYFSEPLYFIYVSELSGLLYYSHIPAILIALLVGLFVLWNDHKSLLNQLLFAICISFSVWTFSTLIAWTNIHSEVLLFAWSFLGPAAGFISIFSIYFVYVFLDKQDVSHPIKAVFILLLSPLLLFAASKYSIGGFNLVNCDAFGFEGLTNTIYFPALGIVAMIWIFVLLVSRYRKASQSFRKQIVLMGTGIEFFLFSFFTAVFFGQYLTTQGFLPDSQLETYGYFGMIVFMIYIGILIVRFKAFHGSLIAVQALVVALIVLIASQFAYVRSTTNIILTAISLLLTAIVGIVLVRSVQKEIRLRKRIELLAGELEKANKQQMSLIHFITHQLKGFVAKSRNIFAMVMEGDYGAMPDTMEPIIKEGFMSATKGAQTIQEILNASNIKSGKVTLATKPFNFKELISSIVASLKSNAESKGVVLTFSAPEESISFVGDQMQMENALKNLVDNSIKYTPSGSIAITLSQEAKKLCVSIVDTGVGITPEDMKHLFTEGGHGAESRKVNVDSTGFGLYIVKNIIEAHNGRVWAESGGAGKGSTFLVELPAGGCTIETALST